MKRRQWIEISDEAWCPQGIRHLATDYCRFLEELTRTFDAVAPLLGAALQRTGSNRIVDMGAGAGGPWRTLLPLLRQNNAAIEVCLTDYNPDVAAFEQARRRSGMTVEFCSEPVDATHVPASMPGFRTMFSAFHHLRPDQARAALADAVTHKVGIAIFEPSERNILLLLPVLGTPIRALLLVPFLRPFRWSNLLWTYLIPVFPFVILFDVVVSFLRIYSRAELTALTAGLDGYDWTTGTVRGGRFPLPILYLIGEPRRP